ncbi:MAG: ester cyclase [Glutamicibacter sp.]|uniref:ester cyclase n=1 Tax=Actinomycetes TaxID=1760 RepID=UPI000FA6F4F7
MASILERITSAWTEAWSKGNTAAFADLVSEDYVRYSKTGEERIDDLLNQITESHQAFSDFNMEILRAIEDDNLAAIHWRSTGVHTGEFMGVPPTGRTVTVTGATFISHCDGKVTEESVVWDPREMLSAMSIWHLGDQRIKK